MHRIAVMNSLTRGTPLAAAIRSTDQHRLAWVGVYPLDLSKSTTQDFLRANGFQLFPSSGRAYRIRTLEVLRSLIESDASIGETELENTTSRVVFYDDDLVRVLDDLGVAVESLELPYKSNYPI